MTHLSTLVAHQFRKLASSCTCMEPHLESVVHFGDSSVLVCCKLQVRLCDDHKVMRWSSQQYYEMESKAWRWAWKITIAVDSKGKTKKKSKEEELLEEWMLQFSDAYIRGGTACMYFGFLLARVFRNERQTWNSFIGVLHGIVEPF